MYCKYRCLSGSLPNTLSDTNRDNIKGAVYEITPLLDVLVVYYMYTRTNRRLYSLFIDTVNAPINWILYIAALKKGQSSIRLFN